MGWYAIKKKTDRRWTAYKLDILPPLKRGYEVLGPFKSYIATIIAANENNKTKGRHTT